MNIFDGTNSSTVIKSLSKVLELNPKQLHDLIKYCVFSNTHNKNLSLPDFFEYCKDSNITLKTTNLLFDRVMFFHKTSFIDDGAFIREKGLRDLDELLIYPSPLKQYLSKKGIEFSYDENQIPFISINGEKQELKNFSCTKMKYPLYRIIARFTKSGSRPLEGIVGFLFLEDEKYDISYHDRIRKNSEFFGDLEDCIGGVATEWKSLSTPAIMKCEVDIGSWHYPDDIYEKATEFEKSYAAANQGFRFLAAAYGSLRDANCYPFIKHGVGIPPSRIKFLSSFE